MVTLWFFIGLAAAIPMMPHAPNPEGLVDSAKGASSSTTGQREWLNWLKKLEAERPLKSHSSDQPVSNSLLPQGIRSQQLRSVKSEDLSSNQVSSHDQVGSNSLPAIADWLHHSVDTAMYRVPAYLSTKKAERSGLALLHRFVTLHPEMKSILSAGAHTMGSVSNMDQVLLRKMGVDPADIAVMSPVEAHMLFLLDGLARDDQTSKLIALKLGLKYSAVNHKISLEDGLILKELGFTPEEVLKMSAKDVEELFNPGDYF